MLAQKLFLDNDFIYREVHSSTHCVRHIAFAVFIKWMQSHSDHANGHVLCAALQETNRADLVVCLQEALLDGEEAYVGITLVF